MKLTQESRRKVSVALSLALLVAVAALALAACSLESESQRQEAELLDKWNALATYWNYGVHARNQFIVDYNKASTKADRAKRRLNAPADYPEELMDAVEAYAGKRATASEWNEFSRAVVDYVNSAMRARIFYQYAGECYDRASRRMSSTAAPPERLADAHRALVHAEREAGRILTRSAKQIDKAVRMNDSNSTSIFFGEGQRLFESAMAAAAAAEKRETKAWREWERAMKAERKRLKSEASSLGVTFLD